MPKRGPKKKATAAKVAAGNPGKRRIRKDEPQPQVSLALSPGWLSAAARVVWNELAADLRGKGILTEWDESAFARYCSAEALARKALKAIETGGLSESGGQAGRKRNPDVINFIQLANLARLQGAEFGLTPSARAGLPGSGDKPLTPEEEAELAAAKPWTPELIPGGKVGPATKPRAKSTARKSAKAKPGAHGKSRSAVKPGATVPQKSDGAITS